MIVQDAAGRSGVQAEYIAPFPSPGFRFYAVLIFLCGYSFISLAQGARFFAIGAFAIVIIMLILLPLGRKAEADRDRAYAALKSSATAAAGCDPDLSFLMSSGNALFIFFGQGRFYFGSAKEPFDQAKLYGSDSVREWKVEWSTGMSHGRGNSASHKRDFILNVRMQSIANPQLKLASDSEEMAYRLEEAFNQMFSIAASVAEDSSSAVPA